MRKGSLYFGICTLVFVLRSLYLGHRPKLGQYKAQSTKPKVQSPKYKAQSPKPKVQSTKRFFPIFVIGGS